MKQSAPLTPRRSSDGTVSSMKMGFAVALSLQGHAERDQKQPTPAPDPEVLAKPQRGDRGGQGRCDAAHYGIGQAHRAERISFGHEV